MKTSLEKQSSGSLIKISEDTLEDRRLVILSGLAGSEKSIVRNYDKIKELNLNTWVIRINLVDHSQIIFFPDLKFADPSSAI